jgi:hypothetical protein
MTRVKFVVAVVCGVLIWSRDASADVVTEWNAVAANAALAACIAPTDNPLHESRMYAMTHLAIHDALNAIDRRSRPYAFRGQAAAGTAIEAAVAAAAHRVMVTLIGQIPFPPTCLVAGIAVVEAAYTDALAAIPGGPAKLDGIALGEAAASAILTLRADDGSDTPLLDFAYPQGTEPGEYRFTPGFDFVFAPGWADVTPFALQRSNQFRPAPPYRIASKKYADDFNEVKDLGGDDVATPSLRNNDQTEVARFWVESSPLQWNRIARTVSESQGLTLWENARLFGLLNVALADGYIASFEAKRHYNFWRPVTAIREGDTDGNPATAGDPTWTPLVPTPPITDHDSGHSTEGGAAAEVLRLFFHDDAIAFSICSFTLLAGSRCGEPGAIFRSFASFSEAEAENGVSRILVGFHFRHAVTEGIKHGRHIGRRAVTQILKPER